MPFIKSNPNHAIISGLVDQHCGTDAGLTSDTIAAATGMPKTEASTFFHRWRQGHRHVVLWMAKHDGDQTKHWFSTKELAAAYRARDPAIRVRQEKLGVSVINGKKATLIPWHAVARVADELKGLV